MAPTVLVVDDDAPLREVVRYALVREGFTVTEAGDGAAALATVDRGGVDLVVLDVMMPGLDGLEVCRRIRAKGRTPIVFLSSRGEELDRILGLELGGDDYLVKPFSPRELVSRVRAVLRRAAPVQAAPNPTVEAAGIRLDAEAHRAFVGDVEIVLTATEFRLLLGLMQRPGRAFTRDEIVQLAYGGLHHVAERTLDSHVRGIRAKLRDAGVDPIETVHGIGYRLRRD